VIFSCENVFEGDSKDTSLINKLTTLDEMSGLLNLALNGLRQLIENGEFDYTDDIAAIAKEYSLSADTVTCVWGIRRVI
jgi:putative DNA primase/helicase